MNNTIAHASNIHLLPLPIHLHNFLIERAEHNAHTNTYKWFVPIHKPQSNALHSK